MQTCTPPFRHAASLACWGAAQGRGGTAGERHPPAPRCLQVWPTHARPPCRAEGRWGIIWSAASRAGFVRACAEDPHRRRASGSSTTQLPATAPGIYKAGPRQAGTPLTHVHSGSASVQRRNSARASFASPRLRSGRRHARAQLSCVARWGCFLWERIVVLDLQAAAPHGLPPCCPPAASSPRLRHCPGLQHVRVLRLALQRPAEQAAGVVKLACRVGAGTGAGSP